MPKHAKARKMKPIDGDCVIPRPVPATALGRLKVKPDPEHQQRHIREYMRGQAQDEKVIHLERVASERVLSARHDVWDVHTDKGRWWVVTSPTNLYSQTDFPSLDYVLSFHVGLMARMMANEQKESHAPTAERQRFLSPWRRWEQAAESLDTAEEAEDFQAIGMRCRECLIELGQNAADLKMLQPGEEAPKRADFVHWAEIIARALAGGSSAEEVRALLKSTAKASWQFVNWLTHAKSAMRLDAQLALDATAETLGMFGVALLRHEHGVPDRCPTCRSYQVVLDFRPDLSPDNPYRSLCARCGWGAEKESVA